MSELITIDLKSSSVEKIIDIASAAIGRAYKPFATRKEADAQAYKIEAIANAEAKALTTLGNAKIELMENAKARLLNTELVRQSNIESIIEKALIEVGDSVSNQPVDNDWRARFFNKAMDISNDEVQEIWARILAREVEAPNSISLRTLEVLSNISQADAEVFTRFCKICSNHRHVWKFPNTQDFKEYGISYDDIILLQDAGLVHGNSNIHWEVEVDEQGFGSPIYVGKKLFKLKRKGVATSRSKLTIPQYSPTNSGTELSYILKTDFNSNYETNLLESFKKSYIVEELEISLIEIDKVA